MLAIAVLFSLFHFLTKYWVWHRTILIVTDRVIEFRNQVGLFSHNTVELLHKDIVEVSFSQSGFDDSIARTGIVNIKTLSGQAIAIPRVKNPHDVVSQINNIRQSGVCIMQ